MAIAHLIPASTSWSSFARSSDLVYYPHQDLGYERSRLTCWIRYHQRSLSVACGSKFDLDDVIEAQQFDRDTLGQIFEVAREMEKIEKNKEVDILRGHLMATLFYEPSTRTRLSFESAMKRLGGEVLTTENAREFSSAAKGETLEGKGKSKTSF